MVYQVLKAPGGSGAVYTVAPVDDLKRVHTVHCDMLKARIRPDMVASPPAPLLAWVLEDDCQ